MHLAYKQVIWKLYYLIFAEIKENRRAIDVFHFFKFRYSLKTVTNISFILILPIIFLK